MMLLEVKHQLSMLQWILSVAIDKLRYCWTLCRGPKCCTGTVAASQYVALISVMHVQIVAVATRSLERSKQFAVKHGIRSAYGSYESLAQDPDVG